MLQNFHGRCTSSTQMCRADAITRKCIVYLRLKTARRNCVISLCFPAVSREKKVDTAIVDVGGLLQEVVDHVSNRRCSICTERTQIDMSK